MHPSCHAPTPPRREGAVAVPGGDRMTLHPGAARCGCHALPVPVSSAQTRCVCCVSEVQALLFQPLLGNAHTTHTTRTQRTQHAHNTHTGSWGTPVLWRPLLSYAHNALFCCVIQIVASLSAVPPGGISQRTQRTQGLLCALVCTKIPRRMPRHAAYLKRESRSVPSCFQLHADGLGGALPSRMSL